MKVYNGTPHPIRIISNAEYNASIRKYVCVGEPEVIAEIPHDGLLSANMQTVEITDCEIPTFDKKVMGADPIPEGYDMIVVSVMYANALTPAQKAGANLVTVADTVYSEDGKTILGCRGVAIVR